jgi:hypothetical protein
MRIVQCQCFQNQNVRDSFILESFRYVSTTCQSSRRRLSTLDAISFHTSLSCPRKPTSVKLFLRKDHLYCHSNFCDKVYTRVHGFHDNKVALSSFISCGAFCLVFQVVRCLPLLKLFLFRTVLNGIIPSHGQY